MSPKTFWIIFLKILGLWLLFSSITQLPTIISSLYYYAPLMEAEMFFAGLFALLIFVVTLYLILRFLVLKPDIIINKLALDKGFEEEKFEINLHRSSVLSIAVIVIGGLMMVDSLPELIRQLYVYFQIESSGPPAEKSPTGYIIFYFIKVFIAYYLITYHKLVVNFIESVRRKQEWLY